MLKLGVFLIGASLLWPERCLAADYRAMAQEILRAAALRAPKQEIVAQVVGVAIVTINKDWAAAPIEEFLATNISAFGCVQARDQIDQLELSVVDLKARYWASQMKEGSLPRHVVLAKKPGSEISNPGIRSRFYSQWRYWYEDLHSARLTRAEMAVLAASEKKIRRLSESCAPSFSL